MDVPGWYQTVLLAAAAFRVWRLAAEDDILDRPRKWALRLPASWEEGDAAPARYRRGIGDFLSCPWCLGFWVAVGFWALWQAWPHATTVIAVPFALSAAVGFLGKLNG